jgi:signal transduction histidine kinase
VNNLGASMPARHDPRLGSRAKRALTSTSVGDVQDIVDLVQSLCEVEMAAVGLLDDGEFHYVVTAGVEPQIVPESATLCQHAMSAPGLFLIPDASADERTKSSPFVDGSAMSLRFYASSPIYAPEGDMVGRLCVFDSHVKELSPVQEHALTTLGDSLSTLLALRMDSHRDPSDTAEQRDLEVAARVSHDLRLPLASLTASLELLAEATESNADPTVNRLLSTSRRSATRMTGLVEALLGLYEVTKDLAATEVDLSEVVDKVLADVAILVGAAGATVIVDELPSVNADPGLMHSVLQNLVSNALKFARPEVAPTVRVSSRRTADGWRIEVSDDGMGIPESERDAVFTMFTRLTDAPGHGIGLTTVAQIIAAHGGSCGVDQPTDQPEGIGSCFWFELPVR